MRDEVKDDGGALLPVFARRGPAAVAAAGLHLLVGVGLLVLAAHPPRPAPGVVSINLVSATGLAPEASTGDGAPAAPAPARSAFADLAQRITQVSPADPATRALGDTGSLSELLGEHPAAVPAASGSEVVVDDRYTRASFDPGAAPSANASIADQARRCLRSASAGQVIIEATLAPDGTLVGRPKVRRTSYAPPGPVQKAAEERAIRAVSDCAPYRIGPTQARDGRVAVVFG